MHCKTQKGKYNLWQKERGVSGWDTTKQNNISISRVVTLILIEYVVDQMPISSYVYLWTCVCFTCQGKSCHPLTIKGFNLEDYPREKWPTHSHSCWVKYYHDSGVNHSGMLVRDALAATGNFFSHEYFGYLRRIFSLHMTCQLLLLGIFDWRNSRRFDQEREPAIMC